jgi:hypothetical protein
MIKETLPAVSILAIAFVFVNFERFTMPDSALSLLAVITIILYLMFSALIFSESSADERESSHARIAGRIGYIFGIGTLVAGIIYQAFAKNIDIWLVLSLCMMIVAKLVARAYIKTKM